MTNPEPACCFYCGEELTEEEAHAPRLDEDGDPMCDDCHNDRYRIDCVLCGESMDDPQQPPTPDAPQYMYGIGEPHERGIYQVLAWPIVGGPLLGAERYYTENLAMIKPMPEDRDCDGGYICPECVAEHLQLTNSHD